MTQPIEYRQIYARLFNARTNRGKFFTESASEALQDSRFEEALLHLEIARSFFPENQKIEHLFALVERKIKRKQTVGR